MGSRSVDAFTVGRRSPGHSRQRHRVRLIVGNLVGATFALYLLRPNLDFFLRTGQLMALVFVVQQAWVALVFVVRRAPETASRRPWDWIAAYGGWFTSFLLRPGSSHVVSAPVGFWIQVAGLLLWAWAFFNLGRSYGIVPANRGLVTTGPYAVVRHPLYSAYLLGGIGYLLQSLSVWNAVVVSIAVSWQLYRISAEELHLAGADYGAYRARVPWRLCPGIW